MSEELTLQDYIDILNLLKSTAIQFEHADRAVEIRRKLEANIESQERKEVNNGIR